MRRCRIRYVCQYCLPSWARLQYTSPQAKIRFIHYQHELLIYMETLELAPLIQTWQAQQHAIAIATVIQTWGSSPRRAGAKMIINDALDIGGSVSGGCVEADVAAQALDVLAEGQPRLLQYQVSDETAWGVGLACGGDIAIWLEPLDQAWWAAISQHHEVRHVSVSVLSAEHATSKALFDAEGAPLYQSADFPPTLCEALRVQVPTIISTQTARRQTLEGYDLLIDVHHPPPRLIIIGGAHVAQALHHIAKTLGFRVWVIDPRKAFATPTRFPDADAIVHLYPDVALANVPLDADSYVAILSHDPKIDDPALGIVLRSSAAYVGVMSSRRTHAKRIERLRQQGLSTTQIERIHTPIGLDIGAKTPAEIALSIMAQIVALRNAPPTQK